MKKQRKFNILIALTAMFLCVTSLVTYAWFTSALNSGNLNFTTSQLEVPLPLWLGRISTSEAGANPAGQHSFDEEMKAYKNDDQNRNPFYYPIIENLVNRPSSETTMRLDNITFGNINDLSELKPENIVYLCLEIPAGTGEHFGFSLQYANADYLSLWVYDGSKLTAVKDNLTNVENLNGLSLLQYQYVLTSVEKSEENADQSTVGMPYASGEAVESAIDADKADALAWSEPISFTGSANFQYNRDLSDFANKVYYLYIKITPNLEAYTNAINYIYSPSVYMDFDIKMEFEITDKAINSAN